MPIERGFAHVLDCGGLRRTTLRRQACINKRYLCGILAFNLSLIMRKLTGVGNPAPGGGPLLGLFHRVGEAPLRHDWQPAPQNPTCRAEFGAAPDYQLII
jgi:hypothetical protein